MTESACFMFGAIGATSFPRSKAETNSSHPSASDALLKLPRPLLFPLLQRFLRLFLHLLFPPPSYPSHGARINLPLPFTGPFSPPSCDRKIASVFFFRAEHAGQYRELGGVWEEYTRGEEGELQLGAGA